MNKTDKMKKIFDFVIVQEEAYRLSIIHHFQDEEYFKENKDEFIELLDTMADIGILRAEESNHQTLYTASEKVINWSDIASLMQEKNLIDKRPIRPKPAEDLTVIKGEQVNIIQRLYLLEGMLLALESENKIPKLISNDYISIFLDKIILDIKKEFGYL